MVAGKKGGGRSRKGVYALNPGSGMRNTAAEDGDAVRYIIMLADFFPNKSRTVTRLHPHKPYIPFSFFISLFQPAITTFVSYHDFFFVSYHFFDSYRCSFAPVNTVNACTIKTDIE